MRVAGDPDAEGACCCDRQEGSGEGRQRNRVDEADRVLEPGHDGDGCAQAGSSGDSQEVGIGQGVAEYPLIGSTRSGQKGSDQEAEHHPRGAQVPDDRPVSDRQRGVDVHEGESVDQLQDYMPDGYGNRPGDHAYNCGDQNRCDADGQPADSESGPAGSIRCG